ncbi:patatin-like phospholipase domain-containing protein 4 isoform X2 [Oratosquilla oratoria]|uniref:patatin-like phospholipase domain-containing protein 4 isoform X2 n=1 Tax=Oratosquilla oratoria TaxID=337810 RepID=UPI003F76AFF1
MATNVIRATRLARTICSNTLLPMVLCDASVLPYQSLQNILAKRTLSTTSSLRAREWVTVTYEKECGEQVTVKGKEGDNLLDVAINNDVDLDGFGACEGTLACSTCHLIFKKEDYDKLEEPPTDEELDMLDLAYGLTDTKKNLCISLAGSGFLGLYLVGACECLATHSPRLLEGVQLAGASSGSLVAACLACDIPLKMIKDNFVNLAVEASRWALGPFSPGFKIEDYLLDALQALPSDAHHRANGRLHISLTSFQKAQNILVSEWKSRDELIDCLRCSCFIPVYSGVKLPVFRGEKFLDGGFTNNLPKPIPNVLGITPFSGVAAICPKDKNPRNLFVTVAQEPVSVTWKNIWRFHRALFPQIEDLDDSWKEGYGDAFKFLKSRKIG